MLFSASTENVVKVENLLQKMCGNYKISFRKCADAQNLVPTARKEHQRYPQARNILPPAISRYRYNTAIRFSALPPKHDEQIIDLPLYAAGLLQQ
jgi:hypothetical protein